MANRSKRERSLAAKRGWETRRAFAQKRSEAAKKGWETRRQNEAKKRRAKKKRAGRGEYQINVKYKPSDKKSKVETQISVKGPKGKSREEVISAVEHRRKTGSDLPGWETRIVEWKRPGYSVKASTGWHELGFFANHNETKKAFKRIK